MKNSFKKDPYPGRPKILFVGLAESSHTHSWIELLNQSALNVRLFALPSGLPPKDWKVRTYITHYGVGELDPETHASLYPPNRIGKLYKKCLTHLFSGGIKDPGPPKWLAQIIRRWQPDVIHTLGIEPASSFYMDVCDTFGLFGIGKWVVQVRGGPDLALLRLVPNFVDRLRKVVSQCDQLLADNKQNYEYAQSLGFIRTHSFPLGVVPGTGGVDVSRLAQSWSGLPSKRKRLILWPKAYECPQSKALPVFEAIRLAWEKIRPCEIHMLATIPETEMWYWTLPEEIRRCCHMRERIPREQVLNLMVQARVMLGPSLSDGTPNAMLEAMAAGAFPIVSPLETIRSVVDDERHVLFARNLYPQEIADALTRAMSDDDLVDQAAERNLELVGKIADRAKIRPRVVEFYERLAKER